jgi:hypothetical protein
MRRRFVTKILRPVWPVAFVAAITTASAGDPISLGDQLKALREELAASDKRFAKEYQEAKSDQERDRATEASLDRRIAIARKVLPIAEQNPAEPGTVDALILTFETTRPGPEKQKALDLIVKDHIASEQLAGICPSLVYMMPDDDRALRAILDKNPHPRVKGNACFSLARVLKGRAERAGTTAGRDFHEAERLFERTANDFADMDRLGFRVKKRLGEAAECELFDIRHLAVGAVAPDIEGEDIDGTKYKLSDYRGKVVLLDFWGHW